MCQADIKSFTVLTMLKDFKIKITELPRVKLVIIIFAIWQYISILGIALLNFSHSLIWLNLGLLLGFLIIAPVYESLLLLILSIPFFVTIPTAKSDTISMWRVLFLALFCFWLIRDIKFNFKKIVFLPWDKYLASFVFVGVFCAGVFGSYWLPAVKQALFFVNIYIFYLVAINVLKSKQQIFETIRYIIWSLAVIITLGFTQLIGSLLTDLNTFWVYWATNVTSLYYGQAFAQVSLYSNSWFSYLGGTELRMFSIMPDSQSFAYICFFALCMGTALTKNVFIHIRKWLWSGIRFAGLAMILSGTRAVWVGMALPFLAVVWARFKHFQSHLAWKFLLPFLIIFALFAASPLINRGLGYLRVEKFQENFLERAQSIYDVKETSNQGRLAMWQESSKFFLSHPFGVGFGNFIISITQNNTSKNYDDLANVKNERYNLPSKYVSAHSLYLQILVETGIFGFGLFLFFWVYVLRNFWLFIRNYKNNQDFLVYFVAQAFLVCLWALGAAVFDITLFNDKVLMFFLLNIGIAGLIVKRYHEFENI